MARRKKPATTRPTPARPEKFVNYEIKVSIPSVYKLCVRAPDDPDTAHRVIQQWLEDSVGHHMMDWDDSYLLLQDTDAAQLREVVRKPRTGMPIDATIGPNSRETNDDGKPWEDKC